MSAPGPRLRPGFVVAVAVAVAMFLGVAGLFAVAVFGDDDEPGGEGLDLAVDVAAPATAPGAEPGRGATATAATTPDDPPTSEVASGGDSFGETPSTTSAPDPISTIVGVSDLDAPESSDELPTPGSGPVEFPALVTIAPPPPTFAAIPLGQLDPGAVAELGGWTVEDRGVDHVALTRDDEVVDIFESVETGTAADAIAWFGDRAGEQLADLNTAPLVLLGSPNGRFVSVAGSQFVGGDAGQQGTTTVSGSVVAGARPDGSAVVLTITRPERSSLEQRAADGELLRAILAHL